MLIYITKARCLFITHRSTPSEVFLGKDVLKIYSKFTREHPCLSVVSMKFLYSFIEIIYGMGFLVNFQHISITPFYKNTFGGLLLVYLWFSDVFIGGYRKRPKKWNGLICEAKVHIVKLKQRTKDIFQNLITKTVTRRCFPK